MTKLYTWDTQSSSVLARGIYPSGADISLFSAVDTDAPNGKIVGKFSGTVAEANGMGMVEYSYPEAKVYSPANTVVSFDGNPAQGLGNTYYGVQNITMTIVSDIVDSEGNLQTQIDQTSLGYPPVLKMPVVKMVGGSSGTAVDEIYMTTTLVNGVLTATGEIPSSGDWKLTSLRINESLKAINADWEIESLDVNILV